MCVHACMRERRDERRDNSTEQRLNGRPAQRKGITHRIWVPPPRPELGASPGESISRISQKKHPEHDGDVGISWSDSQWIFSPH